MKPIILPWTGRDVPHAMLDINRGCNIRCRACYNARKPENQTLAQTDSDLAELLSLRRLHTVTICGGEPLLHPQLTEIVRHVRQRGLRVALATNGQLFDAERATSLREAGLDLVLFHIDPGQTRADLPDASDRNALRELRKAKLKCADSLGIAGGLLSTVFAGELNDVEATVQLALDLPCLRYLVLSVYIDFRGYGVIEGSMEEGMSLRSRPANSGAMRQMTNAMCEGLMQERFSASPFAVLPSCGGLKYDAWLSYQAGVVYDGDRCIRKAFLRSSLAERFGLHLRHRRKGRHAFFHDESSRTQRLQLCLNALTGGSFVRNLRIYPRARRHRLVMKHIVFQQGPTPDAQGVLSFCRDCPDAVVVDHRLLPVCLADRVTPAIAHA